MTQRSYGSIWSAGAALAVTLALAACSNSTPASGDAASGTGVGPGGGTADVPQPDTSVDACALLTATEVTDVIGPNDGGGPGNGVGESVCTWENPETAHSITVSIGMTGTAVGGQLPESAYGETEPGPDGIRYAPGNVAEFAVADRACQIQVVTSVTSDSDRPAATRLVGLIRDRV